MVPHDTIKVGIAGFGLSGSIFHGPFLDADGRYEILGVYERNTSKASEKYPYIKTYRDYGELLRSGIELVVICTPNTLHFSMAMEAIELGINVVLEKPVTITEEEARILAKRADEKGVILAPYMNRRFDGDFMTIQNLLASGRLGDVLEYECHFDRYKTGPISKAWKREACPGVNILYDLGVHIIDQAVTLFGLPNEVYADLARQREETPEDSFDSFEGILYYDHMKAILKAGEVVVHSGPHFRIQGTQGCFEKFGFDPQERTLGEGYRPDEPDWGEDQESHWGTLYTTDSSEVIETVPGNYGIFYSELYNTIMGYKEYRDNALATPEQAADVIRILEAAIESGDAKRRIELWRE